jgi:hypothetical protein
MIAIADAPKNYMHLVPLPCPGDEEPPGWGKMTCWQASSAQPQSVDNVRAGDEEVGARRRLAPTGSTLRVKPDGA